MAKTNTTAGSTATGSSYGSRSDTDYSSGSGSSYGSRSSSSSSSGLKDRAASYGSSASRQIENNPLIAVGAGLALGAVLGAVLPASRKERELLEPVGSKLTSAGNGAIERARDVSKQKFDEMAGDKVREFFGASGSSSGSTSSSSNA